MKQFLLTILLAASVAAQLTSCNNEEAKEDTPVTAKADTTHVAVPQEFIDMLYADQSLAEVSAISAKNSLGNKSVWTSFVIAGDLAKEKKTAEVQKTLQEILATPNLESRTILWAWNGLRETGMQPKKTEVIGVVVEVPVKGAIEYLAMYADGTARYINFTGKVGVWETKDDKMDSLLNAAIADANVLLADPALTKGRNREITDKIRFSLLTTSGIVQKEKGMKELSAKKDGFTTLFMKATRVLHQIVDKATNEQRNAAR